MGLHLFSKNARQQTARLAGSSCVFLYFVTAILLASAQAQSGDDVHVVPRPTAPHEDRSADRDNGRGTPTRMRVDVEMVLVPVTVTDVKNHPVVDLSKQNFKLFEGQSEEKIQYFNTEDAPLSVGILVDLSSSMTDKIDEVRDAASEFFNNANPEDDYFVITFANKPKLLADTTQSSNDIHAALAAAKPKGNTALADAIYMGLAKLRSAKYSRKALLIISDGGDNNSRHSLREIKRLARESDAEIYAIDICDAPSLLLTKKLEERFGRQWLTDVTESTGGRTITLDNPAAIPDAAARASRELRNQYILGYRPSRTTEDRKWRKIKVRVTRSNEFLPVQVYYRTGYMARRD
ncbi:MAG TPA: VWA domain-containing protein [Terriglobales bacterium]|nr:VWA domain-containing protein [Terriglobales bacterium]